MGLRDASGGIRFGGMRHGPIGSGRGSLSAGVTYLAETVSLLTAMTVQPSTALADKINAAILAMQSRNLDYDGLSAWSHLKRWSRPDLHDRQAAKLDWKAPANAAKMLLEVGALTWAAGQGFSLTAASAANYIDTQEAATSWFTSAGGINQGTVVLDLFNFTLSGYSGLISDNNRTMLGQPSNASLVTGLSDPNGGASIDGTGIIAGGAKRFTLTRTGAAAKVLYSGNTAIGTWATAPTSIGTATVKLLYGDPFYFTPPDITTIARGFMAFDCGLSLADVTAINGALLAFVS
jgi:hypothetical protein